MIDTSKMTDAAFLRTLRMRYRSADQPEITLDEVRRLLDIASDFGTFRTIDPLPSLVVASGSDLVAKR
jgi:hypothetical protein